MYVIQHTWILSKMRMICTFRSGWDWHVKEGGTSALLSSWLKTLICKLASSNRLIFQKLENHVRNECQHQFIHTMSFQSYQCQVFWLNFLLLLALMLFFCFSWEVRPAEFYFCSCFFYSYDQWLGVEHRAETAADAYLKWQRRVEREGKKQIWL